MKRFILPKPLFYLFAAPVVALLVAGVWIAAKDGNDSYRLGLGADQILRVVGFAREMALSPNADPRAAQEALFDTLKKRGGFVFAPIPGADPMREPTYAPVNSWGGLLRVTLSPSVRVVRLDMAVDSDICRRIMAFYLKDPVALGLKRIDVLTEPATGLWRAAYDETRGGAEKEQLTSTAIKAFCGQEGVGQIVLTFSL